MKLTLKLTLAFLLLMAAVTLVVGVIAAQLEWRLFRNEHERIARLISEGARGLMAESASDLDDQRMKDWVNQVETQIFQVDWIWIRPGQADSGLPDTGSLVIGRMQTHIRRDLDGRRQLHTYVPLVERDDRVGVLDVAESMSAFDARLRRIVWTSLGGIVALFLLSGLVIALVGTRMVGRPLTELVAKTKRVAEGDFTHPVSVRGTDELATLARALNEMCQQLESQRLQLETETAARIAALNQLRHADRLQTIGQLASGIAHEMGTPLNVIQGHADLIRSGKLDSDEIGESAQIIQDEVQRMTQIVRQVLNLARRKTAFRESFDLGELIEETLELLQTMASRQKVRLVFERLAAPATLEGDREQLKQVLINLVINAVQSMPDGGQVTLEVESVPGNAFPATAPIRKSSRSETNGYCIRIRDQGSGIDPAVLDKIFEPFFTTKEPGQGTGLGLSIAYGIVQDHGGTIDVTSDPGKGTEFRIWLPLHPPASDSVARQTSSQSL